VEVMTSVRPSLEHFSYRYRVCRRKQNADSLRE
jgi:hypothetical protein